MDAIKQASKDFMLAAERSPTLYELTDEFLSVMALLEDPEVDPYVVEQELDRLAGDIKYKAENVAAWIAQCEGMASLRRAEAQRMKTRADADQNRADRLRAYTLQKMRELGIERIDTVRFTLAVRQNPPRVEVLEAMAVPSEFQRTKVTIEPDKKAIGDHYKQTGEVVPGVEIVRGERLDIR